MVRRTRDGTFELRLSDDERDLIASLAGQLRELLVGDETDGLERLFPPGYADDPDREQEYQQLTHDELLTKRLASVDVVEETLTHTTLDEAQLSAWMGAVNDLRLVLGTRLDVTEDMDDIELDDPRAPAFHVYHYLTYVLSEI
ncbi:MAG: hypothetical protein QOG30_3261, partial [Acidimicrobiaceae bacterium]